MINFKLPVFSTHPGGQHPTPAMWLWEMVSCHALEKLTWPEGSQINPGKYGTLLYDSWLKLMSEIHK